MKRYAIVFRAITALALTAGCATPGYYDNGYYYTGANYDPNCDYYTPPWGYPSDYCRYRVWNDPVYYGGVWFNGPIYYRNYAGANWFWLNGDWRRDEWRGPRPNIDFNRGGNQFYRGDIHRGRDAMPRRDQPMQRRDGGDRGDRGPGGGGRGGGGGES